MNREQALKQAEEMVSKLAPATNARGYADGVAPLEQRVSQILRIAEFLYDGEKDAPAPVMKWPDAITDDTGDRWTLREVHNGVGVYAYGTGDPLNFFEVVTSYGIKATS